MVTFTQRKILSIFPILHVVNFVIYCIWARLPKNQAPQLSERRNDYAGTYLNDPEQRGTRRDGALINNADRPNIARLVQMLELEDNDGTLFPAFIGLMEMCFHCHKHSE